MKAWNHLSEQRVPFVSFKVSFSLWLKSFLSSLIVCWPVPSRLKHTFGELFVKVIIGGQWCIHSPGLQSACPPPVTLSDPGTYTSRGGHTPYKTHRKLNTGSFVDTLYSRTQQENGFKLVHGFEEVYFPINAEVWWGTRKKSFRHK